MSISRSALAMAALVLAASCGGGGGGASSTAPGNTGGPGGSSNDAVTINDNYFSPQSLTVPAGIAVKWTWQGTHSHNVTFDDGAHSATQASGTYSRTFSSAGTYSYHCTIHGAAMSGSVTVQ